MEKKLVLKKYHDGFIKMYKVFKSKDSLLELANELSNYESPVEGPIEEDNRIVYWVNIKFYFQSR